MKRQQDGKFKVPFTPARQQKKQISGKRKLGAAPKKMVAEERTKNLKSTFELSAAAERAMQNKKIIKGEKKLVIPKKSEPEKKRAKRKKNVEFAQIQYDSSGKVLGMFPLANSALYFALYKKVAKNEQQWIYENFDEETGAPLPQKNPAYFAGIVEQKLAQFSRRSHKNRERALSDAFTTLFNDLGKNFCNIEEIHLIASSDFFLKDSNYYRYSGSVENFYPPSFAYDEYAKIDDRYKTARKKFREEHKKQVSEWEKTKEDRRIGRIDSWINNSKHKLIYTGTADEIIRFATTLSMAIELSKK